VVVWHSWFCGTRVVGAFTAIGHLVLGIGKRRGVRKAREVPDLRAILTRGLVVEP